MRFASPTLRKAWPTFPASSSEYPFSSNCVYATPGRSAEPASSRNVELEVLGQPAFVKCRRFFAGCRPMPRSSMRPTDFCVPSFAVDAASLGKLRFDGKTSPVDLFLPLPPKRSVCICWALLMFMEPASGFSAASSPFRPAGKEPTQSTKSAWQAFISCPASASMRRSALRSTGSPTRSSFARQSAYSRMYISTKSHMVLPVSY
mmetsp:Transcript_73332/g.203467  ORF Transcript_73332/g.203467 Transcript_73332/m.203467 type:complete len:204 (+) Transcript_73332:1126-1737(+)